MSRDVAGGSQLRSGVPPPLREPLSAGPRQPFCPQGAHRGSGPGSPSSPDVSLGGWALGGQELPLLVRPERGCRGWWPAQSRAQGCSVDTSPDVPGGKEVPRPGAGEQQGPGGHDVASGKECHHEGPACVEACVGALVGLADRQLRFPGSGHRASDGPSPAPLALICSHPEILLSPARIPGDKSRFPHRQICH